MAGAKKYKTKTYRPPDEKFIVIVRPWGREDGAPNGGPNFARNIMAWCEIMIRGEHPGVRPNAVYTTTTRSDVIVEFPEEVDIQPYLGLHRWKKFLVSPYSEQVQSRFSSIYEYHYEHWDHPKTKGWSPNFPNYKQIHPAFPVKHPYPPSSPCPPPPPDIRFTKPLPPHLHLAEGLEQDEPPAPPQPTPRAESSTQASQALRPSQPEAPPASTSTSAFAPYERPSHLPPAPLIPSPPPAIIKKEEEDVKPSLPIRIKPEPVEPELGPIGNYTPSQELLEQLNQLPAGMLATTTTNGNKDIPKIKPDPEESARVMTPIATDNGVIPTIKPEPVEPSLSGKSYRLEQDVIANMGAVK
ncbi:hypothetical protein AX16_003236 [Volvariella volvacea WC 439]|nr:hypothetical protein AX16_003236 [Volvariella volvacea WC 439]